MLQAITKDVPRHHVLCVVGDLNAKVETDCQYCPEVRGPYGIGVINENEALLVDYVQSNDLIIGGTLSEHKTIHKYSLVSPDGLKKTELATLQFQDVG
ncbi:hypothetical protein QYM36_000425 [Artemia franciscana]|uniref:Endonuclease/exonuclease/phosphatase domain-containing protein n=1 Tax=Artemia franciscana TaxID=6661 RepID=A0AA88LGE4_ARTSF|nr:hypothetical protein QYM36_000425 [Artemia franciscana]